ncbi:MAG TPA: hypothetical protein VM911_16440 [Pyrinomonadaceae bacterium]|nr:hypothetical protein [Pyrinomonadaceae bacterium]
MSSESLENLLNSLDELKRQTGAVAARRILRTLDKLNQRRFREAELLIRFHEILLFLCAYPQSAGVLSRAERMLASFQRRIEWLRSIDADLSPLEEAEVSGIVSTSVTSVFSYQMARWFAHAHGSEVEIDWEGYEDSARMGETWPRFLPLLEEDALVEANVPYRDWLRAARGGSKRELPWLIERFDRLRHTERERAELYDSLKLWLRWTPARSASTRTGMKFRHSGEIFYQREPLLRRSDVRLALEMERPALSLKRLSRREGERVLDLIRATSAIRYRELHGFTYGDPSRVLHASAGRGVEFFFNGVEPKYRLPLRAYHSAFMIRNGVPIGYAEGISIFERMEIGFNIYYTFREGESAWLYAQCLRLYRQLLGVTAFSVDPYQIGFENEEGIESGAFWFYRKMGFRPVRGDVTKLVLEEERRVAARPLYRTRAETLRELSVGHMLLEFPASQSSDWDGFHVRNLGLAVQRRMAKSFAGDAERMRSAAMKTVARALGLRTAKWKEAERQAFENLSLVLSLVPDLSSWTKDEKLAVARIIRAKAGRDESRYLCLMQQHEKLRSEFIRLGSA